MILSYQPFLNQGFSLNEHSRLIHYCHSQANNPCLIATLIYFDTLLLGHFCMQRILYTVYVYIYTRLGNLELLVYHPRHKLPADVEG